MCNISLFAFMKANINALPWYLSEPSNHLLCRRKKKSHQNTKKAAVVSRKQDFLEDSSIRVVDSLAGDFYSFVEKNTLYTRDKGAKL